MLKTIDTKFKFLTHKIITFLSRAMVLLFFCIVISTSAKFFAKNILNFIQKKIKHINIVHNINNDALNVKLFKKKNRFSWMKFVKFENNSDIKFDLFITDNLSEIENLSKLDNLQVLDVELLRSNLGENFNKVEISNLRDFITLKTQEDKTIYLCMNKNTKYIELNYTTILNIIRFTK